MEKKITLNDLINENFKERNITHELIKEDLQKITHKQTKKSSFYDHIPTTELERNLNEVISRNSVSQKRREKNILFEFDRKMHRINKIKSKTYRRMRRKEKAKLKELIEESDQEIVEETSSEKESTTSEEESLPRQEISEKEESKESLDEENENDFLEEKKIEVEKCEEKEREIVLPGWGAWGGEGLEITKNKFNTIKEIKEGRKREDVYLKNVIINPNKPILDEKYFSTLPPSVSETIFKKKINSSVSKECNSLRVFNLFVKSKNKKSEEVLEEFCYEPMEE